MNVQFYILGLLSRYGPQHGYLLKQTVEEQISDFTQIKLPTIYYHLEKLEKGGYVKAEIDKDGNRPEKAVYRITEEGDKYFSVLLKRMLNEGLELELPLDAALFFSERYDPRELHDALKTAREKMETKLQAVLAHKEASLSVIPDVGKANARAIFNHHIYHLKAELDWLKEMENGFLR